MKPKLNKRGVVSSAAIYGFFIVFILIMLSIIMSFGNKRFLISKVKKNGASSTIPEETLKATCDYIKNNYVNEDGQIVYDKVDENGNTILASEIVAKACITSNGCSDEPYEIGDYKYYKMMDGEVTTDKGEYLDSCACKDIIGCESDMTVPDGNHTYYCANGKTYYDDNELDDKTKDELLNDFVRQCASKCSKEGIAYNGKTYFLDIDNEVQSSYQESCDCYFTPNCEKSGDKYCYDHRVVQEKEKYLKNCLDCNDDNKKIVEWHDGLYTPLDKNKTNFGNIKLDTFNSGEPSNCTCGIYTEGDKTYYIDDKGKKVNSKKEYIEAGCLPTCTKSDNGKYYNSEGEEVETYEEYVKSCEFPCPKGTKFNECLIYMERYQAKLNNLGDSTYQEKLLPEDFPDKIYDTNSIIDTINKRGTIDYFEAPSGAEGLHSTKDGEESTGTNNIYGDSYYYRGAVDYNYVKYADHLWRIVRLNGSDNVSDSSIRLILDDDYKSSIFNNADSKTWIGGKYKTNGKNVGIMYHQDGLFDLTISKDKKWANDQNSTILQSLYDFYNTLSDKSAIEYDVNFCADKNVEANNSNDNGSIQSLLNIDCNSRYSLETSRNICSSMTGFWSNFSKYEDFVYYKGLSRTFSGSPNLICSTSCDTERNDCNQAINLSNYSASSKGKVKYDVANTYKQGNNCGIGLNGNINYHCVNKDSYKEMLYNEKKCTKNGGLWKPEISSIYGKLREFTDRDKSEYRNYMGNIGNGQLEKPIGLISIDEAILSGVVIPNNEKIQSGKSAISSSADAYWTSTAAVGDYGCVRNEVGEVFGLYFDGTSKSNVDKSKCATYYFAIENDNAYLFENTRKASVRPVINLKSCVTVDGGDGTEKNPFTLSTSNCTSSK